MNKSLNRQLKEKNHIIIIVSFLQGVEESFALSPDASDKESKCQTPNGTQVLALSYKNYALTFIFAKDSSTTYVQDTVLAYSTPEDRGVYKFTKALNT